MKTYLFLIAACFGSLGAMDREATAQEALTVAMVEPVLCDDEKRCPCCDDLKANNCAFCCPEHITNSPSRVECMRASPQALKQKLSGVYGRLSKQD